MARRKAKENPENSSTDSKPILPRVLSGGHYESREDEARRRLGITREMMDGVPSITSRIKRAFGTVEAAIETLRGDDSADAQRFMARYRSISESDRERLELEEIVVAAGLTVRRFVEVAAGAVMQESGDVTRIMVAMSQPAVTQATIDAATRTVPIVDREGEVVGYTYGDVKAQELFHKATGFLPMPKGATTTINLNQLNAPASSSMPEEKCLPPQSMDAYLLELQDVIRPNKELPAMASVVPIGADDAEYVDVEM